MKRLVWVAALLAVLGASAAATANHDDRHCAVTIHEHLGTDDVPVPLPDDVPTDIGWLKVFLLCEH